MGIGKQAMHQSLGGSVSADVHAAHQSLVGLTSTVANTQAAYQQSISSQKSLEIVLPPVTALPASTLSTPKDLLLVISHANEVQYKVVSVPQHNNGKLVGPVQHSFRHMPPFISIAFARKGYEKSSISMDDVAFFPYTNNSFDACIDDQHVYFRNSKRINGKKDAFDSLSDSNSVDHFDCPRPVMMGILHDFLEELNLKFLSTRTESDYLLLDDTQGNKAQKHRNYPLTRTILTVSVVRSNIGSSTNISQ
ncbi:hypothetical protein ACH5RR_015257 [Cinchona calisaya]|uniref:Uncharacterized protein n=1 Tax=Cinchona calisaya TaxID=153742 RepID=A0ABD2ZXX9_9GENT